MSSTNRGRAIDADYYVTPQYAIEDFLREFNKVEPHVFNKDTVIVDPTAGGDEFNPMSYPEVLKQYSSNITTIDIRKDSRALIKGSYLDYNVEDNPDVIITNPPFNIALDIIKKSLIDIKHGGYVIMLLRLNFFGSKGRFEFWQNYLPKYAFVHSKRMSFIGGATEKAKTDSIEYMHCCWQKGYNPEFVKLKVI